MGEAKRRAERRWQARAEGKPFEPTPPKQEAQRELRLYVRKSVFEDLDVEYQEFLKNAPAEMKTTRDAFIEGLLETVASQLRMGRDALKARDNLVKEATPGETATILGGKVVLK